MTYTVKGNTLFDANVVGYFSNVTISDGGFLKIENLLQGLVSGYTSGGYTAPPTLASTTSLNTIDKFPFSSDSNATDVGDLTVARNDTTGHSSESHGYVSARGLNLIERFPFAADLNSVDTGADLLGNTFQSTGTSSKSHGYIAGGKQALPSNSATTRIMKFPFSAATNATQVGNLAGSANWLAGSFQSITNGYFVGGYIPAPSYNSTIQKYSFVTDGNGSPVGNLSIQKIQTTGQNSITHGYSSGGVNAGVGTRNDIDKFSFSSEGTAVDIGNLTVARYSGAGQSSTSSGYMSGGENVNVPPPFVNYDIIDKFPFATDTGSASVGALTQARSGPSGQQR